MNLSGFDGSASVKEQLSRLETGRRMPHAVMIDGATSEKRAALCDIIAMWAVCKGEGEKPCGVCRGCLNAKNHRHIDVKIVEGSGKTGVVSVETIRNITADSAIIPNEADTKVYIIYDADKRLSGISQNAFLKTLEEPPANVLFLLTCEDNGAMLETVRSRAAMFSLDSETGYTPEQIEIAERIALGMIEDSEYELLKACFSLKNAQQADVTLEILALIMRDGLVMLCGGKTELSTKAAEKLAQRLTREKFLALGEVISLARVKVKQNVNMKLLTTWLCAELRRIAWRK